MSKKVIKRIFLGLLIALFVICSSAIIFFVVSYNSATLDINKLTDTSSGVKVYALSSIEKDQTCSYNTDRKIINISELNDYTIHAFIDIEDKRFYSHSGYDLMRIAKSMLVNLQAGEKQQGASTITQQLIKNTLLSNEKTYKRKFNEILLAIKTEKAFSKEEILNMYLNSIYFGSNAYGIESASQIFFGKSAKDLTINESAILAGVIKSPKHFSPKTNKEACFKRKNLVLNQMYKYGHLSREEYQTNTNLDIDCVLNSNSYDNSYHQQAILEACKILNIDEKELIREDYQIVTYLDQNLQNHLDTILSSNNYDCDKLSIVANSNGEVLAYSGQSLYDLSNLKRAPASTLKPLAVYLPAIENNLIYPCTPINDEKTDFNGYSPRNVNDKYHGWVSARYALANSLNVPAVKVLEYLTPEKSYDFLSKLGLDLDEKDKTLSLSLGGLTNGVQLIDLLQSYTVLQDYGKVTKLKFIDKILDKYNRVVYQNKTEKVDICSAESAYLVTDMLKDTSRIGNTKQLSALNIDIASKTGTNFVKEHTLDLYNISYTPQISVITWLGDVANNGLEITSSYNATNINKEIFEYLQNTIEFTDFEKPNNIIEQEIDLIEYEVNNKVVLANDATPDRYKKVEIFKSSFIPLESGDTYSSPNLDFTTTITDYGTKINVFTNEIYEYQIIKITNNYEEIIAKISEKNGNTEITDEKIFSYDKIDYKIRAKHRFINATYLSENQTIYPKDYLFSKLNNNEIIYNVNTKTRWYV